MSVTTFGLIFLSVCVSATAQILLKSGMTSANVKQALATGEVFNAVFTVATNPFVFGGLAAYFCGASIWLFVLAKVDVSQAYPFVGLGFIVTMIFAATILGEHVGLMRFSRTMLVAVGAFLIARG